MKKLSVILLALAIAAFAVPAMAGDFTIGGSYTFGGESVDEGDTLATYYDELDIDFDFAMGDVKAHWDVEVTDDDYFDKNDDGANGIIDGYCITWQATDAFKVKLGEYGFDFGQVLATDSVGNGTGTIGLMYGLDVVDIALYIDKDYEGSQDGSEDDDETMGLLVTAGETGPFDNLGLVYISTTNDYSGADETGLVGFEFALGVGPVAVAFEYDSYSSDDDGEDGGTLMWLEVGMEELVGFGLNLTYIQTNDEWAEGGVYGNDYDIMDLFGAEPPDATLVALSAEYGVNDALTVSGAALVMAEAGDDDIGTEIDVAFAYSLADNVGVEGGYSSFSPDAGDDVSKIWYEFAFDF